MTARPGLWEDRDPTHSASDPRSYWSTTNLAEIAPGVSTPLSWTLWGSATEQGARASLHSIGVLRSGDVAIPQRQEDRAISIFYGHVAARIDFFCEVGDLMPGTSGPAVAQQIFSFVPPDYQPYRSRRRYPIIAARFPVTFRSIPGRVARARAETQAFWEKEIPRVGTLSADEARAVFHTAKDRFEANVRLQGVATLAGVQPVYDQMVRLASAAGVEIGSIMAGNGSHEETQIVDDLWACSRGRIDLATVARRHGYHGPREGEISSRVWREAAGPLLRALEGYRDIPDDADPVAAAARHIEERRRNEQALVAALPVTKRAQSCLVLRLAHTYLPFRGVCKVAFLQAFDVARAAARRIGECLVAEHAVDDPGDIFFLTADEVERQPPGHVKELIAARRERMQLYLGYELPPNWQGQPEARRASGQVTDDGRFPTDGLTGIGVSPGVVTGTVRVVSDPATAAVKPGDVLVARTTDPSWAPVMFLASAMVVDIGGLLSHAAIVARELGVPCVMNTGDGTRILRSGDVCRVDGSSGKVEILERGVSS